MKAWGRSSRIKLVANTFLPVTAVATGSSGLPSASRRDTMHCWISLSGSENDHSGFTIQYVAE